MTHFINLRLSFYLVLCYLYPYKLRNPNIAIFPNVFSGLLQLKCKPFAEQPYKAVTVLPLHLLQFCFYVWRKVIYFEIIINIFINDCWIRRCKKRVHTSDNLTCLHAFNYFQFVCLSDSILFYAITSNWIN